MLALYREAAKRKETLRVSTQVLVHHGIVAEESLAEIKGLVGYKNVASDLMVYARVLLEAWPGAEGKIPLTRDEVQQAKQLGLDLLRASGLRDQTPRHVTEAQKIKDKAFYLLCAAHNETRRALTFLRWDEDDTNQILPSFYAGRGGRGRGGEEDAGGQGNEGTAGEVATSPNPGRATNNIPPGFPGASPLIG